MSHLTAAEPTKSSITNNEKSPAVTKIKSGTAYKKQPKNATATNQITNWLKAVSVAVKPSTTPGSDLVVTNKAGQEVEIKVGVSADDARPAVEHLFVLAKELTHRNKGIALKAFHSVTEAIGFGSPKPIDRGAILDKKAHFDDSFELVAMRHAEFRKVPNPSTEDYAAYEKVISKAVNRFLYINTKICRRHGLDFGDLKTYAQIWTANFLGLYKVADPQNNDNERKLYAHLCQRFGNFVEVLLKKERSCIPDLQTTSVALFGRPYEAPSTTGSRAGQLYWDEGDHEALEVSEADAEATFAETTYAELSVPASSDYSLVEEEEQEQKVSDAKRRTLAQKALKAEFAKLDHDTLVTLLTEAVGNGALCFDARTEARKQLRLHTAGCASCAAKIQEQAAGTDAGR
jgi:hypothetical protein